MELDRTDPKPVAPTARSFWNSRAVVLFVALLVVLTGIGLASWLYRPAPPSGLPEDGSVASAIELLGGSIDVDSGNLRFVSSLGEGGGVPDPADSARARRLTEAAFRLEQAQARHRFDPRFDCLLGHVAQASDRLELAERRYRAALSLTPGYGEARLGLGVVLARQAAGEGDRGSARGMRLQAIAQFAAVDESDPFYLPALFDRALLLVEVGRIKEARRLADRYTELEPGSVWSGVLRRRFDPGAAQG
jgi:tetratricopeptide (TPR) repeat protein